MPQSGITETLSDVESVRVVHTIKDTFIELKLQIEDNKILVIYGRHINGYFIALPGHFISCEALSPDEVERNTYYLSQAGLRSDYASTICSAINDYAEGR